MRPTPITDALKVYTAERAKLGHDPRSLDVWRTIAAADALADALREAFDRAAMDLLKMMEEAARD